MPAEKLANVIARIQKLRELSSNNENEHEAAAAAAAAAALITKFQLTEIDLELKGEKDAEPVQQIVEPLFKTGRTMLWVSNLALNLCEHYGCTGYFTTIYDPMGIASKNANAKKATYTAFKMIGRKSDCEIVQYMFDWLQPVIIRLMKQNASGQGMKYSQNYAIGVVAGIKHQLDLEHQVAKAEAAKTNQSQAMVMLDCRVDVANKFMKLSVKGLHDRKTYQPSDAFARDHGFETGKNIPLNKGLGSSTDSNKKLK